MKIKKTGKPFEKDSLDNKIVSGENQFVIPASQLISKKYLITGIILFLIAACAILYFFVIKNDSDKISVSNNSPDRENELRLKELELMERELKLREEKLNNNAIENYSSQNDKEDIRNVVNNMLNAWQNKDINGFFSNLTPDYRYESIDGIKRNYSERLDKAYDIFRDNDFISINVWDMSINNQDDIAQVRYRQDYRSTRLSDVTTKKMFLRKENGRWLVYKELSGFE